ncbi:MAG: HEPN domain-containing protein [Planctomycetes bacterium]|nr:HEPN domain-containing protein [Planctomycetota bacterium]
MNRTLLQRISNLRVREARSLLRAGHSPGAYYLVGYAIECALKACVARQIKQHDFPDKKLVNEAYTHDLEKLVRVAGLSPELDRARRANLDLDVNWAVVKDWSESSRYDVGITPAQAEDILSACTSRKNGVLTWIKSKW